MKLAAWVSGVLLVLVVAACGGESLNPTTFAGAGGSAGVGGYAAYGGGTAGYAGWGPAAGYSGGPVAGTAGYVAGVGGAGMGGAGMGGAGIGGGGTAGVVEPMDGGVDDGGGGFSGGSGTGATGGAGVSGGGGTGATSADPIIPPVTGDCPVFRDGTISFMGLGGIELRAGPKAPGPTAPMLLYWHGTGSTAGEFAFMAAPVANGVTSQGGVITSFQGTSGGGGCSCSGTSIFCMSDMDIADQLVACAVRDHNVDPRRIFTMGCSAGGLFATCLAANRSEYIAAAAPNSGGFPIIPQPISSPHVPALMCVHGGAGDNVGINFGQSSQIAEDAFVAAGGFAIDCDTGNGHCGGSVVADQVWEFFQAHPFGVDPWPWLGGLPPSFPSYCRIVN